MKVTLFLLLIVASVLLLALNVRSDTPTGDGSTVEPNVKSTGTNVDTDTDVVKEALDKNGVKHEFQAEINQLLAIIINSLYSNKEIFLRELISNASDALNKIRFLGLTDKKALESGENLEVRIQANKELNTLTIKDTGIGMTRSDLLNNLGTIAKSGTKAFLEKLQSTSDYSLIGQFGVGFYSAFLVADQVVVITKHNDDQQLIWTSTADNTFTITEDPRGNTLGRGTEIILHLKDDAKSYIDDLELRNLISKYSEFISYPIHLYTTSNDNTEVPDEEAQAEEDRKDAEEAEKKAAERAEKIEKGEQVPDEEDEEEKKPKAKKTKWVMKTTNDWKWINQAKPIWTRDPKDIHEADYHQFYRAISREFDNPLIYSHFSAEGGVDFKALMYVPFKAPQNLFDFNKKSPNVKLYVKRVFITEAMEDLLPRYFNFIRGVVDSEDLPLNVSRENLQHSKLLRKIKKKLVAKIIGMLQDLADKEDEIRKEEDEGTRKRPKGDKEWDEARKYTKCWKEFGKNIRLGIIEDEENRKKMIPLLRFPTSRTEDEDFISLDKYVERMKEGQKSIYFLAGESMAEVKNSPHLEQLQKRDYEVLFLTDAIDEYAMQHVKEYKGKPLQNIASDELTFGDEDDPAEKERWEAVVKSYEPLIKFLEKSLGKKVTKAQVGKRLSVSPCVLASPKYGISANMQRIMRGQALSNEHPQIGVLADMKILEINPDHPIIENLNNRVKINDKDTAAAQNAELLYETAVLRSGYQLVDTSSFADRINTLMKEFLESAAPAEPQEEEEEVAKAAETEEEEKKEETEPEHDEL